MKQHQHIRPWTDEEDEMLLEMVGDEILYRDIAAKLGRTRNSCIGRMHRLAKMLDNGNTS
jgi:hypothetical protein